jgi:hypothetical protein
VLDEPDDPRTEEPDFVNLERVEGRWLVDEIHEDIGTAGTEAPVPRPHRMADRGLAVSGAHQHSTARTRRPVS